MNRFEDGNVLNKRIHIGNSSIELIRLSLSCFYESTIGVYSQSINYLPVHVTLKYTSAF